MVIAILHNKKKYSEPSYDADIVWWKLLWILPGEPDSSGCEPVCVCLEKTECGVGEVLHDEARSWGECLWLCRLLCHVCFTAQTRFNCSNNATISVFYTVFAKIKTQLHIKYLPRLSWCGLFCLQSTSQFFSLFLVYSPASSDES